MLVNFERIWRKNKASIISIGEFAAQRINLLVIGSLLLVLYSTLFPFDFSFLEISTGFDSDLAKSFFLGDCLRNILLFLPFGFSISCLIYRTRQTNKAILAIVVIASASLSFSVEVLQLFLPQRISNIFDILANTVGGYWGFICFCLWGEKFLDRTSKAIKKIKEYFSLQKLILVLIGYAILILLIALCLQNTTKISNWDSNFPLVLSNEQTGERPWQGYISDIFIADRAISNSQVKRIFAQQNPLSIIGDDLVASYPLTSKAGYLDLTGHLPKLIWQGTPSDIQEEIGVFLNPSSWLITATPASLITKRVRQTNQFTLIATVATADTTQDGPARIITFSGDPYYRNFSLTQEKKDLVFRLQIPLTGENGTRPAMRVPNVWVDTKSHHLIITYDGAVLRIYVDKLKPFYSFELTPGTISILKIGYLPYFPKAQIARINPDGFNTKIYKITYYGLIFIPFSFLLTLIVRIFRRRLHIILIFVGMVFPPVLLEAVLVIVSSKFISWENLLLSTVSMVNAMLMFKK